ncbi:DUF3883 domain-containing protein [Horticoccus sp. 23ND18S-11]|uniref:DUF3883 domain-containing protein n=1 Tax=Horticoccus sp. 23ND18S-11 TaxID=3391832 RepID=UPI0039C9661A
MLPTRGTCHGIFLLTHSARSGCRRSIEAWVAFAKGMPTVMAAAVNLEIVASVLCASGLAAVKDNRVIVAPSLAALEPVASDEVLMAIAAIFLAANPPPWLHASVGSGRFYPEYVPTSELSSLRWLEDALEPLLAGVKREGETENAFKIWLGALGESLIISTERGAGAVARQVSLISDQFGYDVESLRQRRYRFEVKTSIIGSDGRFYITRNEVNTAKKNPEEWFLVQVVLKPEAVTASSVTPEHVHLIRQLSSGSLVAVVPVDSEYSRWIESAEVSTETLPWMSYELAACIPHQWRFKRMAGRT